MTRKFQIITAAVLVTLIAIVLVGAFMINRGALSFAGFMPQLNPGAITNPVPSLDREIVFPANYPEAAREKFNANLAKIKEQIRTSPSKNNSWFDLAIYYRMINDHKGAAEIWEYMAKILPTDAVSRRNLGEYYFHTVKDYDRAEEYYRESISVDPTFSMNYTDLHEMYRYATNEPDKAIAILKEGISKVAKGEKLDLTIILATFHGAQGETDAAISSYTDARDLAHELGNTQLARQLDQEIANLR